MAFKGWKNFEALGRIAMNTKGTALAHPLAAGAGLLGGGVMGIASSNEGRGPVGNTLFWAPIGAATGIGIAGLAQHGPRVAAQAREAYDFLRRAPKEWKGAASDIPEIQRWVRDAEAAAETNPAMRSISRLYQGLTGTPDSYLARGSQPSNQELLDRIHGFLKKEFGVTRAGAPTAADFSTVAPDVPDWLRDAMSVSHDLGDSADRRKGFRTVTGQVFNSDAAAWNWGDVLSELEVHGSNADRRHDFLSAVSSKLGRFSRNWGGGLSVHDIGLGASAMTPPMDMSAVSAVKALKAQGQRRMARWLWILNKEHGSDLMIRGVANEEIGSGLTTIEIGFKGGDQDLKALTIDIPDEMGLIRHGRFGRNIHVPRNVVDLQSIRNLYNGSLAKTMGASGIKPRLLDPSTFVLKNLAAYYKRGNTVENSELVDYLRGTYGRATSWDSQVIRSDREGLEVSNALLDALGPRKGGGRIKTPGRYKLRMQSSMVALPVDLNGRPLGSLMERMRFPTGEAGPLNFMGQLQGNEIPDWLSKWGFYTTASENQARNATFSQALKLVNYDLSMLENPLSKPSILERDVAKPYRLAFNESLGEKAVMEAKGVSWVPFASKAMRADFDAYEQGFLLGLHPVFESEVSQIRQMAFETNLAKVDEVFASAGINPKKFDLLRRNLRKISYLDEGIIATTTPRAIEMANAKLVSMDLLNKNLLKPGQTYKDLIGQKLGPGDYLGLNLESGDLVGHTFSERENGYAIIRDVLPGEIDPDTLKEKLLILLEERYPGQEAKIGHASAKAYQQHIESEAMPEVTKLLDYWRTNKAGAHWSSMYGNQPVVPIIGRMAGKGVAVQGLALQSTMYKFSNRFSTMFNNLLVKHMPMMTDKGYKSVVGRLRMAGVNVNKIGDQFTATMVHKEFASLDQARTALDHLMGGEKGQGVLRKIFMGMYTNPQDYFRPGVDLTSRYTSGPRSRGRSGVRQIRSNSPRAWEHVQNLEMMTGIYAPAKLWDSLEHNIPRQASITMHEMMYLEQYGMKDVWTEMMGRGRRKGTGEITRKYYGALAEMGSNRGLISNEAVNGLGLGKFTLDDVGMISRIDTRKGFQEVQRTSWRHLGQFEDNFIIDLETANASIGSAGRAVREALGTTRILVPGTKSDIWGTQFVTATGMRMDTESFLDPLQKMLGSVSRYYGDPVAHAKELESAASQYRSYLSALDNLSKAPYTGRGGALADAGPWAAGRLTFRPYRNMYKGVPGMDEMTAAHIVGVSPRKFESLTQQIMREHGLGNLDQLVNAGLAVRRGPHTFLLGISKRYPITDAGAVLMAADETLQGGGIGMEGAYRFIKNADFDGDTLVAHVLRTKGGVKQALESIIDPSSKAYQKYHEFLRVSDIFGGVEQDLMRATERGMHPQLYSNFAKRIGKFLPMMEQSQAERMGKMWTMHIGRYSNLSKLLAFMTDMPSMNNTERAMRAAFGRELQQMSIDFGRAATAGSGNISDPTALAQQIGIAWRRASDSPASATGGGNEIMRDVFKEMGFREALQEKMMRPGSGSIGTPRGAGIEPTGDYRMLEDLTENFFSTRTPEGNLVDLDKNTMAMRGEFLDSLLKRGLRRDKLGQAISEYIADQKVRGVGGMEGWLNIPSHMPKSGEQLSAINDAIKNAARGIGDIGSDLIQRFKGSPEAQAAGALVLAAGAVAAGIGFMTPATPLKVPDYPTYGGEGGGYAARAIMRSPDVATVGMDGEAPIPGSRGGHVASRNGPDYVPNYSRGVFMKSKRYYYDQSNRTPRTVQYSQASPEEAAFRASEMGDEMQRRSGPGMSANVNVVNSPGARRYSREEMRSKVRDDLYR